jgi:two-component system sensor histidine kinase YesM
MVDDIYSLTHKIFNMQQKLYEAELQKNQFKLFGLQSQINSHFLYNTLNCLRGMARKNAYEEINSIIKNLVAYFRYNMKGSEFVTLAEEIEHMQNYYEIQKTRFGDKFCFIYDVAENIKRQSIIKLSLQPLIENIFLHAFQNKRGIGIIKVKAKRINDIVEIRVMDNGEGIDQKILKELKRLLLIGDDKEIASLKSIGIINIQQRLKIYYGEQSGLRIMSKKGFGTVVIIKMPMKIMEDFTDV